jgi:hypothetical protein
LIAHRALDLAAGTLSQEGSSRKTPSRYGENRSAGKAWEMVRWNRDLADTPSKGNLWLNLHF